jgi:hypothetical protein
MRARRRCAFESSATRVAACACPVWDPALPCVFLYWIGMGLMMPCCIHLHVHDDYPKAWTFSAPGMLARLPMDRIGLDRIRLSNVCTALRIGFHTPLLASPLPPSCTKIMRMPAVALHLIYDATRLLSSEPTASIAAVNHIRIRGGTVAWLAS